MAGEISPLPKQAAYSVVNHLRGLLVEVVCRGPNEDTVEQAKLKSPSPFAPVDVVEAQAELELRGYFLGSRIVDRLAVDRPRIRQQRDCLKFICREVWAFFFRKQATRLQTNKRGGYIILDDKLLWLDKHPLYDPSLLEGSNLVTEDLSSGRTANYRICADAQAALVCGIVRGALNTLGVKCVVHQELRTPPACSFHVSVL